MSSTNRGYERHKSDYYVTPVEQIVTFLNEFMKDEPDAFNGYILDPCAGGDPKHPMSYPEAMVKVGIDPDKIFTVDIREDSLAETKGDYLEMSSGDFQVIITNPPFNISEQIIRKAMNDVNDGGFVIMLLRLNYFGGQARFKGFWKDVGLPKYAYVHHKRMSFTEDGKTDSIEYAHFCFQKGYRPRFTQLKII